MSKNFNFDYSTMMPTGKRKPGTHSLNAVPPPPKFTTPSNPFRNNNPAGTAGGAAGASSQLAVNRQGYSTMNAISQNALSAAWGGVSSRKRAATEDEYFDEDAEEEAPALAYIPAPGSPSYDEMHNKNEKQADDDEDEDDPLDAYMAGLEQQIHKEKFKPAVAASSSESSESAKKKPEMKSVRNDLEEEDDEESYYRYMEENPTAGLLPLDDDVLVDYDEDGNPIPPERKRIIDPLPPIDHDEIPYEPFRKNFYCEHEEIAQLSSKQVHELRVTLDLKVTGKNLPKPVASFAHFNLDDKLLKTIIKAEYTTPTSIQSQAVPAALIGRDILGIAQTGSGKTAAFLWPMMMHVAEQPPVKPGEGPIALVLAPTRELALQIYTEARKFARVYDIRVVCAYGGGNKWEQSQALKVEGAEIVVATPGRLIDHVKGAATNLARVTFLVLDEADRMFELGFEPQVRSVCNHVRPDRQTLLFSATFRRRIERLAKDALTDPVHIAHGTAGQANEDITQHAVLLANQEAKRTWLFTHLVALLSAGSVLLFVTKKLDAEQMAADLKVKEYECLLLHGDMDQMDRNQVIMSFKRNECSLLVATDVAARGLDIPHVRTVVNFDLARDADTHTHRVGRTGRAGMTGTAYTLITDKDKEMVGHIVNNLEAAHQYIPPSVMALAMTSSWFRKSRTKKKDNPNVGGLGLGFKEKSFNKGASLNTSGTPEFQAPDAGTSEPPPFRNTGSITGGGPATDRLAAMKAAFKSQYKNQFTSCSDTPVPPPPPMVRNKKSRWE